MRTVTILGAVIVIAIAFLSCVGATVLLGPLGLFIWLVWMIHAVLVSVVAMLRGRDGAGWALLAIFLPLYSLLLVILLPGVRRDDGPIRITREEWPTARIEPGLYKPPFQGTTRLP